MDYVAATPRGGWRALPAGAAPPPRGRPPKHDLPVYETVVGDRGAFEAMREQLRAAQTSVAKQKEMAAKWREKCKEQTKRIQELIQHAEQQEKEHKSVAAPRNQQRAIEANMMALGVSSFNMPLIMAMASLFFLGVVVEEALHSPSYYLSNVRLHGSAIELQGWTEIAQCGAAFAIVDVSSRGLYKLIHVMASYWHDTDGPVQKLLYSGTLTVVETGENVALTIAAVFSRLEKGQKLLLGWAMTVLL